MKDQELHNRLASIGGMLDAVLHSEDDIAAGYHLREAYRRLADLKKEVANEQGDE